MDAIAILPAPLRRPVMRGLLAALVAIALTVPITPARAATITVTNTADAGGGSLRAQIAAANANDTIDFSVTGTN